MIKLNEVDIPDFIRVNSIEFSVLPPLKNNFLSVRGKAGVYHQSQDKDEKVFTVHYTLVAEKINGVMEASEEFAEWLHHEKPVKAEFSDKPEKYYMVVPDGETNVTEIVNIGQGEFRLVCTEPYAYGKEVVIEASPAEDELFYFDVDGNVPTFPEVELHVKNDITSIGLTSGDGHVLIGEPHEEDETPVNLKPTVFRDLMNDAYGWADATQVDNGVVHGKFVGDGTNIIQEDLDYGENPEGWSGASGMASLDRPVKNFEATIRLGLYPTSDKQLGRIHMYLLDENNRVVGRTSFYNMSRNTRNPRFMAHAGYWNNRHVICNTPYSMGESWARNFYGVARIGRVGQNWYAYAGRYNSTTKTYREEYYTEWHDRDNEYSNNEVTAVQIHIGRYKDRQPTNRMFIADVKVDEIIDPDEDTDYVPIVAVAGDTLRVDTERSVLYRNDEVFYEGLNPSSTFFNFKKGENGIGLTSTDADMTISYKERWY